MVPCCPCAGHPAGVWGNVGSGGGGPGPDEPPSSSSRLDPPFPLSSLTRLPCCSLLHALPLPLIRLSTGVHLLWFTEAHYQFPANLHPRPASRQQHTTTRSKPREAGSWIDAFQRIHCCWRVLPIPVIMCAAVSRVLSPLHPQQSPIIKDSARCARQPWQVSLTFPHLYLSNVVSNPPWWTPEPADLQRWPTLSPAWKLYWLESKQTEQLEQLV